MIPTTINPHGLEDRTLTLHVLENGIELETLKVKSRLYCYATFPSSVAGINITEWAINQCVLKEQYENEPKYVSREKATGNKFMVLADQDFYFQTWIDVEDKTGAYAVVSIIDTSGSMGDEKGDTKNALVTNLSEFACQDGIPKLFVFSGRNASTFTDNSQTLDHLNVSQSSISTLWDKINDVVNDIMSSTSSSEAMMTCLYAAIGSVMSKDGGKFASRVNGSTNLKSLNFVLLTDESMFTSDTMDGYSTVVNGSTWLKNFQSKSATPLPTDADFLETHKSNKATERREVVNKLNNALKQISYYTGINITFSLTSILIPH